MNGCRVTRRMPRAGSASSSVSGEPTAVGLSVLTPHTTRSRANGRTTRGSQADQAAVGHSSMKDARCQAEISQIRTPSDSSE